MVTMSILDIPVARLDGTPATVRDLTGGRPALLVNVASKCGLTPQYEQLEQLQQEFGDRFSVVGFPCNQFGGQEPGTAEEIQTFCSTSYGVSFPLAEKVEVNGEGRHPLYAELTAVPDAEGEAGDIQWNFEKFVIDAEGEVVGRFRPRTTPDAAEVRAAITGVLAGD